MCFLLFLACCIGNLGVGVSWRLIRVAGEFLEPKKRGKVTHEVRYEETFFSGVITG